MDIAKIIALLTPITRQYDGSVLNHLEDVAMHTTPQYLKAGERFPIVGQENIQSAYIAEGILRIYFIDPKGHETTVRLQGEGDFATFLEDYPALKPSLEFRWEAVTPVTLLSWKKEDIRYLAQNIPGWYFLTVKILKTMVLAISVERAEMFNDDATTRYLKFAERYPRILACVPLRHVANYLGIAPQSLSRIRQKLSAASEK